MNNEKHVGRPLKFQSVEELQKKIDAYFEKMDKEKRPYTITGLALALDTNRETLVKYEHRDTYSDTVKKAKLKCENYAEESLFTSRNTAGVIFNMKNNYGWTDKQEVVNIKGPREEVGKDVLEEEFKEFDDE